MFDNEQATDDLTMQFIKDSSYSCCAGFRIRQEFEIRFSKSFKDPQSLRKIYDSISRLKGAGKIAWTEQTGYKVAEEVVYKVAEETRYKVAEEVVYKVAKND